MKFHLKYGKVHLIMLQFIIMRTPYLIPYFKVSILIAALTVQSMFAQTVKSKYTIQGLVNCQSVKDCTRLVPTNNNSSDGSSLEYYKSKIKILQRLIHSRWLKTFEERMATKNIEYISYKVPALDVNGQPINELVKLKVPTFLSALMHKFTSDVTLLPNKASGEYNFCQARDHDGYNCSASGVFDDAHFNCKAPLAFAFPQFKHSKNIYLCHRFFNEKFHFDHQAMVVLHEYIHTLGVSYTPEGEAQVKALLKLLIPNFNSLPRLKSDDPSLFSKQREG